MASSDMRIIDKAQSLAEHTFKLTSNCNRFPKKYRHSLVDKMQNRCIDIYTELLEANRIDNTAYKRQRCNKITLAIAYCDELLFFIELSMRLEIIGASSVEKWSSMVTDVKHMALAWRTKESK